jgi:hypothetical protein
MANDRKDQTSPRDQLIAWCCVAAYIKSSGGLGHDLTDYGDGSLQFLVVSLLGSDPPFATKTVLLDILQGISHQETFRDVTFDVLTHILLPGHRSLKLKVLSVLIDHMHDTTRLEAVQKYVFTHPQVVPSILDLWSAPMPSARPPSATTLGHQLYHLVDSRFTVESPSASTGFRSCIRGVGIIDPASPPVAPLAPSVDSRDPRPLLYSFFALLGIHELLTSQALTYEHKRTLIEISLFRVREELDILTNIRARLTERITDKDSVSLKNKIMCLETSIREGECRIEDLHSLERTEFEAFCKSVTHSTVSNIASFT